MAIEVLGHAGQGIFQGSSFGGTTEEVAGLTVVQGVDGRGGQEGSGHGSDQGTELDGAEHGHLLFVGVV